MLRWFIYALVDPRTVRVRYVGATSRSPLIRLAGHIGASRKGTNAKRRWIQELRSLGLDPFILVLETGAGVADWSSAERSWIKLIESVNPGSLLNILSGGQSILPKDCTESHKRRISQAKMGYKHTEEAKRNISKACLGRRYGDDVKAIFSEAQRDRRLKEKLSGGVKFSESGLCNIREAAKRRVGVPCPELRKQKLREFQRTPEEKMRVAELGRSKSRAVLRVETGEVFPSIKDAARSVGVGDCQIRKSMRKGSACKGFHYALASGEVY